MSKTAQGRFNNTTNKWEAVFQGKIIASTSDRVGGKDYLRSVIIGGLSKKAKASGITNIEFNDEVLDETGAAVEDAITIDKEFPINERFAILEDYVDMVAKRKINSALVTGEGGLGKTFTVMQVLKDSGLQDLSGFLENAEVGAKMNDLDIGYIQIKGFSTPKAMYRTLYEHRKHIIVFDDCDSIQRDPNAVNVLKAALDSYETRMVSWNAESFGNADDGLPRSFEFTGGILFISNLPKEKIAQPIRSRAPCIDVGMSRAEVIERMRAIVASPKFMPEAEMEHKQDALEFVAQNAFNPLVQELNLRTLINVVHVREAKPDSWKRMGLYSMANA